jgi:hypothetical protein
MVGMPPDDIFLIRTLVENVGTSDEGRPDDEGRPAGDWEDAEMMGADPNVLCTTYKELF